MKKQTDTFKRLRAVIKDITGDNRQIIKAMQDQIEYLMEFIDIQGKILEEQTGCRLPEFTIGQKKRLTHRGKKLNEFLLGQIEHTFAPSTILKRHSELISNKYNNFFFFVFITNKLQFIAFQYPFGDTRHFELGKDLQFAFSHFAKVGRRKIVIPCKFFISWDYRK